MFQCIRQEVHITQKLHTLQKSMQTIKSFNLYPDLLKQDNIENIKVERIICPYYHECVPSLYKMMFHLFLNK